MYGSSLSGGSLGNRRPETKEDVNEWELWCSVCVEFILVNPGLDCTNSDRYWADCFPADCRAIESLTYNQRPGCLITQVLQD